MSWERLSEGLAQARREMAARERRAVEQQEVADALGVSVAAYSRWERGAREPQDREMVARLAAFFGVTPAYLRFGIREAEPTAAEPAPPRELPPEAFEEMPDTRSGRGPRR
jgi:transcriptional regulator with XRE-family HTH domain